MHPLNNFFVLLRPGCQNGSEALILIQTGADAKLGISFPRESTIALKG